MRTRLLVLLFSTALLTAGCGSSDDVLTGDAGTTAGTTPGTTAASTPSSTPADTDAAPAGKQGECKQVSMPGAKPTDTPKPTGALDPGKRYVVVLSTSCGVIRIDLDQAKHPKTANAVATLVRDGYYDGTPFHRIVNGWVAQGGDPLGNGNGGPSWKVVEAPAKTDKYTRGVVAMAKTGADAPGTIGSQFFIVVADDAQLPPDYAIAGKVTSGIAAADAMSNLQAQGVDGRPPRPVVLTSAKLLVR